MAIARDALVVGGTCGAQPRSRKTRPVNTRGLTDTGRGREAVASLPARQHGRRVET